jgi:hypothetical protein
MAQYRLWVARRQGPLADVIKVLPQAPMDARTLAQAAVDRSSCGGQRLNGRGSDYRPRQHISREFILGRVRRTFCSENE